MNSLFAVARQLQDFCEARDWRFCFIGGIAVQRWAEPRVTDDADLTLLTGFGGEEKFVDDLLTWLHPREPDGREFALRHRVLLAQSIDGIPLDIALGALPFEESAVARSAGRRVASRTMPAPLHGRRSYRIQSFCRAGPRLEGRRDDDRASGRRRFGLDVY